MNQTAPATSLRGVSRIDRSWLADQVRRLISPLPLGIGSVAAAMLLGGAFALGPIWQGAVLAVLVAPWFVAFAVARPAWLLTAVVTLSPFDPLFFGELQKVGAAHELLSLMRFWKEAGIVALGVAALIRGARGFDALDVVGLALVAVTVTYLVLPVGPPFDVRLVAARQDGFLVLIFLIVRHLPIDASGRRLLAAALLLEGAVTMATGLWNVFDARGWSAFLIGSGTLAYQAQQAGGSQYVPLVYSEVGGRLLLHASGLFLSSLSFGFFMLVPLGIAASRAGFPLGRWLRPAALFVGAAGTMLSLTRTAIFAMLGVVAASLMFSKRRVLALTSGVLVALALVPLAAAIGLGDRLGTTLAPTDASSTIHLERLGADAANLIAAPLGHGLGTAASTGARFNVAGAVINESWYFQIGFEMGVVAFLLVVLLVVGCLIRMASSAMAGDAWSQAGFLILGATATCAIFLHAFDAIGVAWPVWTVVAIGCSFVPSARGQAPDIAAR